MLRAVILAVEDRRCRGQFGHAVALGEIGIGEHRACPVQQGRGYGGGAVDDAIERAKIQVPTLCLVPVKHHLDHGWREQHLIGFLLVNGMQNALRGKGLQNRMGRATDETRRHRREVRQVKHRHRMEECRPRLATSGDQGVHRRERHIAMAEHHPFRSAGGAAGVENAKQGITAAARIFHRLADLDQGFVVEHPRWCFAVTGVDHHTYGFRLFLHLGAQCLVVIVDDQHGGF
ncbi:hypothetical protein D3C84_649990 [compost metagenome]